MALKEDVSQASKTRTQFRVDLLKLASSENTAKESKNNTEVNSSKSSNIVPIDSSLPGKED